MLHLSKRGKPSGTGTSAVSVRTRHSAQKRVCQLRPCCVACARAVRMRARADLLRRRRKVSPTGRVDKHTSRARRVLRNTRPRSAFCGRHDDSAVAP
ncbi:hypothetical protein MRX96_009538 [Rhipicephalus microplus]